MEGLENVPGNVGERDHAIVPYRVYASAVPVKV